MRSIFSPFLAVVLSVASVSATVTVTTLRCEYAENPLGIDSPQPRLSWVLESEQRAQRQTAYQVFVASSEQLLKPGKADLWDSGKVAERPIHPTALRGQTARLAPALFLEGPRVGPGRQAV